MELEFYLQRTICINLGRTTCEFAPRLFLARVKSNIKQLSLSIFLYQPIPMEINCTLRIRKICTSPVDYAQVPIRINISSFHMTYIIIINITREFTEIFIKKGAETLTLIIKLIKHCFIYI